MADSEKEKKSICVGVKEGEAVNETSKKNG